MRAPGLVGLFALAAVGALRAQDESKIRHHVEQLGSDDYQTRADAEAALDAIGEPARALLEEASRSSDLETRGRAVRLLGRIGLAFLRGGELARWDSGLVQRLFAAGLDAKLAAGWDLVERLVEDEIPVTALPEVEKTLRHLGGAAPGEAGLILRIGLVAFGSADGLVEAADDDATGRPYMNLACRALAVYRGPIDPFAAALEATEGADRTRVEILLWQYASGEGLPREGRPRSLSGEGRARVLLELVDRPPGTGGERNRLLLELILGDPTALSRLFAADVGGRFLRDLDRQNCTDGFVLAIGAYRPAAERRRLIAAAAELPDDVEGVVHSILMPWFADDPAGEFAAHFADPSPRVRELAAMAAGEHRLAGQADSLRDRLHDAVYEVRLAAAWALGELGAREEALAGARRSLASQDGEEIRDAVWILRSMDDPELAPRVRGLLADPRPTARAAAAYALFEAPVEIAALLGDGDRCTFYPRQGALPVAGTVDQAVRTWLEGRMGSNLPAEPEAARAAVTSWSEARAR